MFNPGNEISSINFGSIIGGSLNAVVRAQAESAKTTVNFIKGVGFKSGEIDAVTGEEKAVGEPIYVSFTYDKEVSPYQVKKERIVEVTVPKASNSNTGFSDEKKITLTIDGHILSNAKITLDDKGSITSVVLSSVPDGDFIKDKALILATEMKSESGNDEKDENGENAGKAGKVETTLLLSVTEKEIQLPALFQKMEISVPILTILPIPFIKVEYADIEFNVKINSVSNTNSSSESNTNIDSQTKGGFKSIFGAHVETSLNATFSNQKKSSSSEEVKKDYSLNIKVRAVQDDMPLGMSRILDILEDSIVTKTISEPVTKANS